MLSIITALSRTTVCDTSSSIHSAKKIICSLPILSHPSKSYSHSSHNGLLTTRLLYDKCDVSNPLSRTGLLFGSNALGVSVIKYDLVQPHQVVRHNGRRVGVGPRGNHGKRSPNTIQGVFQCHPHRKKFKKTLSRRFPGHVDCYNRQG